jgi:hypothetical protein
VLHSAIKRYINAECEVTVVFGLPLTILAIAGLYGMIQVFWDKAPHKLNYRLLVRVLDYLEVRGNKCPQNVGK